MDYMMRVMLAQAAGGGGGGSLYDDEFSTGSTIDTAGTRYASAIPWTLRNTGAATYGVSGGLLTVVAPTVGGGLTIDLKWSLFTLPAGASRWRTSLNMVTAAQNFRYMGIGYRRSSDGWWEGIGLSCDSFGAASSQVRRGAGYTSWAATDADTAIGTTSPVFEIERTAAPSYIWRYSTDGGASFTTQATGDQFEGTGGAAPDEIGIFVSGGTVSSTTGTFDWFRRMA